MLSARLIRNLLKRLFRVVAVFTRIATSSAQKLRVLLSCFRRFVTEFRSLQRHSIEPRPTESAPEPCTALTNPSTGWCSQSMSPLPFHTGQIVSVAAGNSAEAVAPPSPPPTMPIPSVPQQGLDIVRRRSLQDTVTSNGFVFPIQFKPLHANNFLRYGNRPLANKNVRCEGIPTLTRKFHNGMNGDIAWQPCVHPEGALYFYNYSRKSFTEGNKSEIRFDLLDGCVDILYRLLAESVNVADDDVELFLQVSQAYDSWSCQYYFVDHANRTLFWLQDYVDAEWDIFCGLEGVDNLGHMAYALESEYWVHCERYPNHELKLNELLKELRGLVVHARAESIISDGSLSPFGVEELSGILDIINHLEVNVKDGDPPHSTCVISKFMHHFSRAKFFNFCGLPFARLDVDQSVYGEVSHPLSGIASSVLDAVLFWSPRAHYDDLRRVWVDNCIIASRWKEFGQNLTSESTGITQFSTIMLAVNVSFLAVPNMFIPQSQSVGVIAIYVSTIFITGSLIASIQLTRGAKIYNSESAQDAVLLILNATRTPFRMRALVTFHSLPYAMLIWGMIFFGVGFLYNVFKSTTMSMLASVVSAVMIVTVFMLWIAWAARSSFVLRQLARLLPDFVLEYFY